MKMECILVGARSIRNQSRIQTRDLVSLFGKIDRIIAWRRYCLDQCMQCSTCTKMVCV